MTDAKVNTFFVSEKISKVRWLPENLKESERFLTGSWDMPANFVRLWRLQRNQYADDFNEFVPRCSDKIQFRGDVTGLEYMAEDVVASSCADGRVTILKINRAVEEDTLQEAGRSAVLHTFNSGSPAPCTGISVYGNEIASVGEDGRLNIFDAKTPTTVRRTIEADSCALTAVTYVNPQEVLTANRMGVIRIFDVRSTAESTATASFMASCEDEKKANFVSCITSHPTQPHIVLAGSEEGSITVWDLRQLGYPASYLSAHTSTITEIAFHRTEPSRLFTSAEDGELWLWSQLPTMADSMPTGLESKQQSDSVNPWLSGERAKNRISVTSLITELRKSINSFDSNGSKIICGSDSEAIYFIDNVF